jgi:hypothetical protein
MLTPPIYRYHSGLTGRQGMLTPHMYRYCNVVVKVNYKSWTLVSSQIYDSGNESRSSDKTLVASEF